MNLILIIVGAFIGCLLENIMLGVIQYYVKARALKGAIKQGGGVYVQKKR